MSKSVQHLTVHLPGSISCSNTPAGIPYTVDIDENAPAGPMVFGIIGTMTNGTTCGTLATVTVPEQPYPTVEILYKTFIAADALEGPLGTFSYFAGDNRGFTYMGGTSRSFQRHWITLDPSHPNGIFSSSQFFYPTKAYNDNPTESDVFMCGGPCPGFAFGGWCIQPGAMPECQLTAMNGEGGNVLSLTLVSENPNERRFKLDIVGFNPCVDLPGVPAIDAHLEIEIRRRCENGVWLPIEYRIPSGQHDGFPWHEMYINGTEVYRFDACIGPGIPGQPWAGPDPFRLFGSGDIIILARPEYVSLGNWQVVPGQ